VSGDAQVITSVAGTDFLFPRHPLLARNAPIGNLEGIAMDVSGTLYVCDGDNDLVFRVDSSGTLSVLDGNGVRGFSGDNGPATNASLNLNNQLVGLRHRPHR